MGKVIVIDPGHGGQDPGATGPARVQEKTVALATSIKLFKILSAAGAKIRLTRTDDSDVSLARRVEISNEAGASVYISIHANAYTSPAAKGMEVWTAVGQTSADPIAHSVATALKNTFPNLVFRADMSDGDYDKEANFYVLYWTLAPAILIELAFISNPAEEALLVDPAFQDTAAWAIAEGIAPYLGLQLPPKENVWDPYVEIDRLRAAGIINGSYSPADVVTWGQFATVINKIRPK